MQKKIGIITFHNSINYGAVLQTFALQEFLKKHNYDVSIIDYCNEKINSELSKKINGNILKVIIKKYYRKRKFKLFNNFCFNYLNLSDSKNININNIINEKSKYDVYITGSDQVWNLDLTGNDKTYFLDFADDHATKIAYAVSVGDNNINLSKFKDQIYRLNYISFREKSFKEKFDKEFHINSYICCDPTLLLNVEDYKKICSDRIVKEKYVFCFMMENKKAILDIANRIAEKYGYRVIDNKNSFKFFMNCKPTDFLSWIQNAEVVLTDSFHGTVFSIIFNKKFLSDKCDSNGNIKFRMFDLLNEFGVSEQFVDMNDMDDDTIFKAISTSIDYEKINRKVLNYSKKSSTWLLDCIKEKKKNE